MAEGWQILVVACTVLVVGGALFVGWQLRNLGKAVGGTKKSVGSDTFSGQALEESAGLFNQEFHEELRNRGRLHFEKIITENAMFLKQDLDMTIAQLNEYLKKSIGSKLNEEFSDYEKAMKEAQELALNSLHKSATAVDEQRLLLVDTMKKDVTEREAVLLKTYELNMAEIIEHYILESLGDQFDLKSQLPYIISQMEANKQNIMDDMRL